MEIAVHPERLTEKDRFRLYRVSLRACGRGAYLPIDSLARSKVFERVSNSRSEGAALGTCAPWYNVCAEIWSNTRPPAGHFLFARVRHCPEQALPRGPNNASPFRSIKYTPGVILSPDLLGAKNLNAHFKLAENVGIPRPDSAGARDDPFHRAIRRNSETAKTASYRAGGIRPSAWTTASCTAGRTAVILSFSRAG